MNDLISRYSARKFVLPVLGVITIVILPRFGIQLSDIELGAITVLISAFIGVEGAADYVSRKQESVVETVEGDVTINPHLSPISKNEDDIQA